MATPKKDFVSGFLQHFNASNPPSDPIADDKDTAVNDSDSASTAEDPSQASKSALTQLANAPTTCHLKSAIACVTSATEEDKRRNYDKALRLYERSITLFTYLMTSKAIGDTAKEVINRKLTMYVERAEKIQNFLDKKHKGQQSVTTNSSEDTDEMDDDDDLTKKITSSILIDRPNVKWDEVAGLEGAKQALIQTLILPNKFPQLMSGKRKPWNGILLFGHQGTGKSHLIKAAIAESSGRTVFSLTPTNLVAKWLGESEKLAKLVFEIAREKKPSIIFIDEVDAFSQLDTKDGADGVRRMKIEFLLQTQGANCNDDITVLGATNKPWLLDDTLLRWFEKKIYTPLPDEEDRLAILKMSLGKTPTSLFERDFAVIAKKTEGYSGADIDLMVKDAVMQPVKKLQNATHFAKVKGPSRADPKIIVDDLLVPCSPYETRAIKMSFMDIPGDKLAEPTVTMDDMTTALENSKGFIKSEDLNLMKKFMEEVSHEI